MRLRVVVDESLPKRLASELRKRGYGDAVSCQQLGLTGTLDGPLLEFLNGLEYPAVLVTFDNKMAAEHAERIRTGQFSLAVVDSRRPSPDLTLTEYLFDVVHRNAHRLVEQQPGTAYAYFGSGRRRKIDLEKLARAAGP